MAARSKLQSTGRLLDPLVEAVWGGNNPLTSPRNPLAALNAWRHRRRAETANSEALQRLLDADKHYRTDAFLAAAKAAYVELLGALSAGRLADEDNP